MDHHLKILHLEDLASDAELVARSLKKGGIEGEIFVVSDKTGFMNALNTFSPDIIISDHSLPSLDSHEALEIIKEMGIRVPVILVTATVSEEYAASMIKDGASDYILKDRLQRLPNAVKAAIEKHKLESEQKEATELLVASEKKYKLLFEKNPVPMWMVSRSTLGIIAVNDAAIKHYGYTKEEFLKLKTTDLRPKEEINKYLVHIKETGYENSSSGIWRHKKKNGTIIIVEIIAHDVVYEDLPVRLVLANDVTQKIKAEAELAEQRRAQQQLIRETSIQVQEKEREEIGKELHDNITQILAASKFYIDYAIKNGAPESSQLQKSQEHITLAIQEIRKLSHSLIAPSLGDISLLEAIEKLTGEIQLTTSLRIKLIRETYNESLLNKDLKLTFYRIIQEQLNNILKHAGAKKVIIQLITLSGYIRLSVKDDGQGFDSNKKAAGIGLRNIKNRVEFYDGTAEINSSPGKGCTLEITIPIK
ncbi:MAG TPA: PAS domain S-box protein [Chitinophagaceae bacterium]|nr:PAS domain S-box protein [Chitinophagaceae bacterium]